MSISDPVLVACITAIPAAMIAWNGRQVRKGRKEITAAVEKNGVEHGHTYALLESNTALTLDTHRMLRDHIENPTAHHSHGLDASMEPMPLVGTSESSSDGISEGSQDSNVVPFRRSEGRPR